MPGPAGAPGTPRTTATHVKASDNKGKGKGKTGDVFYVGEEVRPFSAKEYSKAPFLADF